MRYKFKCPECFEVIYTNYLKIGEYTKCQYCGSRVAIPTDAVKTDEVAQYDKDELDQENKIEKTDPFERFPRMNTIVTLAQAIVWAYAALLVFVGIYVVATTTTSITAQTIAGGFSYVFTAGFYVILVYAAIEVIKVFLSMEKNIYDTAQEIQFQKNKR